MYHFFIFLFALALKIAAWFNPKIRQWNVQRSKDFSEIISNKKSAQTSIKRIWFHCASLGEFEQARFVIDRLYQEGRYQIYLSFFSPSGYQIRKNYPKVHHVFYLPLDHYGKMKRLVEAIQPGLYVGVKYEYWWNLFKALNHAHVSKIFIALKYDSRPYFMKTLFKGWFRRLSQNAVFFTQDQQTTDLLNFKVPSQKIKTVGDPRVSSVVHRYSDKKGIQSGILKWVEGKKVIVYGSVYTSCLPAISENLLDAKSEYLHILVPHDVSKENIAALKTFCKGKATTYSEWTEDRRDIEGSILIIDVIGLLFDLYLIADVVYVGGGFEKNVHNTLEPARLGLPLSFGPKHRGFEEIDYFLQENIASEIHTSIDFKQFLERASQPEFRVKVKKGMQKYFDKHADAGLKISEFILSQY